jgi:hypothetical protein
VGDLDARAGWITQARGARALSGRSAPVAGRFSRAGGTGGTGRTCRRGPTGRRGQTCRTGRTGRTCGRARGALGGADHPRGPSGGSVCGIGVRGRRGSPTRRGRRHRVRDRHARAWRIAQPPSPRATSARAAPRPTCTRLADHSRARPVGTGCEIRTRARRGSPTPHPAGTHAAASVFPENANKLDPIKKRRQSVGR